jgi:O6-methylguanine-DNA--protein-cysteine methyltransferase
MDKMKQVEKFFDAFFEMNGNIALSFIRRLAPFAVPAAPAFFFAHAVYTAVVLMTGNVSLAVFIGLIAAAGLESVGILSAHVAVKFYTAQEHDRAGLAAGIAAFYLLVGIGGIWLLESTARDAKITGTVMFLIAGAVYLLIGLLDDARARQDKDEAAAKFALEQKARDRETAREIKRQKAMAAKVAPQPPATAKEVAPVAPELTPAQQRVYSAIKAQPDATYSEVAAQLGVSRQYVGKVAGQLNGHLNGHK